MTKQIHHLVSPALLSDAYQLLGNDAQRSSMAFKEVQTAIGKAIAGRTKIPIEEGGQTSELLAAIILLVAAQLNQPFDSDEKEFGSVHPEFTEKLFALLRVSDDKILYAMQTLFPFHVETVRALNLEAEELREERDQV